MVSKLRGGGEVWGGVVVVTSHSSMNTALAIEGKISIRQDKTKLAIARIPDERFGGGTVVQLRERAVRTI